MVMPRVIDGETFYFAHEAAKQAGISKATLLRWIEKGLVSDAKRRDRNEWRLFSAAEIARIRSVAAAEAGTG